MGALNPNPVGLKLSPFDIAQSYNLDRFNQKN